MPILYKSSSFSTYGYYLIYPVLICISVFFTYGIISYGNFSFFNILIILIFIYVFITSTESLLHLKYIEVNENHIIIKTFGGNKIINFRDVFYIYNLININGSSVVIWYKDTDKNKVILVRPDDETPSPSQGFPVYSYDGKELSITKYIKEKALRDNPNYLKINNPRWFLFSISPTFGLKNK